MQVTAVEPYQEGSLWTKRSNAWDMLTTEILHKLDVLFDVSQHLLAPFLTLTESGDSSDRCEERRLIQLIGYQPSIELQANFLIRNDGIAANQSCNIEGLGRSLEGDTDVTSLVRHRGKRNMLVSEDGKVGMDFIRDDKQVMLVAEVSQTLQSLLAPSDASRVVRVAEDEYLAFLIAHLLQVFEVHVIVAIITHLERIEDHLTSVAFRSQTERMIDRWLNDDFFIRIGEDIDYQAYTLDDTRDKLNPFSLHIPLMMVVNPVDDAWHEVLWLHGVAEERVL